MPADGLGKGGGVALRWVDGKKYKSGTGNWEIFSWKEPTEGQGAFTCSGSSNTTLAFKSLLDMKMC